MRSLFLLTISFFLLSCENGNTQTVTRDEIANAQPVEVPLRTAWQKPISPVVAFGVWKLFMKA
jgi:peptide-methionine (S)-S-oxide reductase